MAAIARSLFVHERVTGPWSGTGSLSFFTGRVELTTRLGDAAPEKKNRIINSKAGAVLEGLEFKQGFQKGGKS